MTFPLPEIPLQTRIPRQNNIITPLYNWDIRAGRYTSRATGRFVSFAEVRGALENVIFATGNNMVVISSQLQNGYITLATWERQMMAEIKALHIASAAASKGGWAQMTTADWGYVGSKIRAQYDYLRNFASQIYSGKQKLDGRFIVRTKLYGQAGRGTFESMRRREAITKGYDLEIRILGIADHCPGCLQQSALKWQPIGTLDAIGEEECATNCHCYFMFKNSATNEIIEFY